jgi:hypothetical protein
VSNWTTRLHTPYPDNAAITETIPEIKIEDISMRAMSLKFIALYSNDLCTTEKEEMVKFSATSDAIFLRIGLL